MSTIPNASLNRLEIIFYSTLTSVISGVHRIRAHFGYFVTVPPQSSSSNAAVASPLYDQFPAKQSIKPSNNFGQLLLSVFIWTILGFCAGFLIGMLNTK
jgi:hypothetical protein